MKRYKREQELSYALGMTLTFELLRYKSKYVTKVFVNTEINKNEAYEELMKLCRQEHVEVEENNKVFHVLSKKENCYVIGEFQKFESKLDVDKPHIILVNPSDMGNLGTLIRSSVGFGFTNMAIISPGADHYNPKVVRASMGSIFRTKMVYFDTIEEYLDQFNNHTLYPFMLNGTLNLPEVDFMPIYSLVFGNEATGLPEYYQKLGQSVVVRHSDHIDSLNLPIAASLAMYQATIQDY